MIDSKLTGRFYHRRTWQGLVLMVEYSYEEPVTGDTKIRTGWKKANEIDLLELEEKRPNLFLFKAS